MFSHDLKRLPCHRFARGTCINSAEACKFGHFIPEPTDEQVDDHPALEPVAPSDLDIFARSSDFIDPSTRSKTASLRTTAPIRQEVSKPESIETNATPVLRAEFDVPAIDETGSPIPLLEHFLGMDPSQSPFL